MSGLRTGYTTGACASAAAKAAAMALLGLGAQSRVEITLANGAKAAMDIIETALADGGAMAAVIKDAGDDPDVTHGARIAAQVWWMDEGDIVYEAGEGVGTVTRKGLSMPPGSPAINPGPRRMIAMALRDVTDRPARVRVSIPGGRALAQKTFNPRLGVVGGLSILGTTGIVRPYSLPALRQSILCGLDVALAEGGAMPVLTPGNIGTRAAREIYKISPEKIVEAGNEWGFILEEAGKRRIGGALIVGHPGKLAKLAMGQWDTHSKRSEAAAPFVAAMAEKLLGRALEPSETVEGIFDQLNDEETLALGQALAEAARRGAMEKAGGGFPVAVALVNMKLAPLGTAGDMAPWSGV
jgi:cobalt-precorrin-5B (C1)-methyltransferase